MKVFERGRFWGFFIDQITSSRIIYFTAANTDSEKNTELATIEFMQRVVSAFGDRYLPIFINLSKSFEALDQTTLLHK